MILGTHFRGRIGFWSYIRRGLSLGGHLVALAEKVPFLLMFGGNLCSKGTLGKGQNRLFWGGQESGYFGVCL